MQKHRCGKPGSAPFPALYYYRDQQRQSGIVLKRDDFDADFLCWASRYLKTFADFILDAGQSLVKLIDDEHSRRRSEQEIYTQGEVSREALLKGLERMIPDSPRCNFRGTKIPIPYITDGAEAMRRREHLDIVLKVDPAKNQPSSTLCAPNARPCDQTYHMRIKCTYVLKEEEGMHWRELWVTQGRKTPTHMRLCQMRSLADHVRGRDREYTIA